MFRHNPMSFWFSSPSNFLFWWSYCTFGPSSAASSNWTIFLFSTICPGGRPTAITSLADVLEEVLRLLHSWLMGKAKLEKILFLLYLFIKQLRCLLFFFSIFLHHFGSSPFQVPTWLQKSDDKHDLFKKIKKLLSLSEKWIQAKERRLCGIIPTSVLRSISTE